MKRIEDLLGDFKKIDYGFDDLNKKFPRIVGNIGKKIANENFDVQGFKDENSISFWKQRSSTTNKIYDKKTFRQRLGFKGSVYSSKNPILRQTGNLKNAITYRVSGNSINIGVNLNLVPYAKLMNEGGSKKFGKKWVRIPARKFLGYSKYLAKKIEEKYKIENQKIFKDWKK